MKANRIIAVLISLCLAFVLAGCSGNPLTKLFGGEEDTDVSVILEEDEPEENEDEGLRNTVLYYRNEEGLVIPVMKKIPWEEGIGKAALGQLIDQPVLREDLAIVGLQPVLPSGTEILGMSINDGLCKVDFNKNILSYDSEIDEKAIVQSIVYTLTEFPAIDRVQLMVDGEIIKELTYGTKVNVPLERENINLVDTLGDETVPVTVYYKGTTNGEDNYFIPVTKGVNALKADVKSVLVALLEGAPEGTGLYTEIPEGVSVNDVYVKEGIAYVDLTEEIKRMPENEEIQQSLVYEIGLTLKEVEPSINQVRLLSGGKEIELQPGVSLNLPRFSNEY